MAAKPPRFSGQLVKVTGEGEHMTLAFTAGTVRELREAAGIVHAVALERVNANNQAVLDAATTFEERQVQVFQNAVAQLRRELGLTAPGPDGEAPNSHADDTAGPIHASENP
jgi:hypothetical protein